MSDCPYVGLVPFEKDHARYFFGRGDDISRIIANLSAHRLTLLYGPSGVGKSSVLNAGVIAAIDAETDAVRARGETPDWEVIVFRGWQSSPVIGLRRALDEELVFAGQDTGAAHDVPQGTSASRTYMLAQGRPLVHEGLLDYFFTDAREKCANEREGQPDLLIILDQFEEFFLYHGASDEGRAFIDQIATVIMDRRLRAGFMISMREDSLAKLDVFKARIPFLFDNCLRLGPLTEDGARDAITRPLEVFNETHDLKDAAAWSVATTLVNEVINEVRDGRHLLGDAPVGDARLREEKSKSKSAVDAACLQMVMSRLWTVEQSQSSTTIRLESFNNLGRSKGIIGRHLDTILNGAEFSDGDRKLTAEISRHLVTSSNSKIAHSAQDLVDLTGMGRGAIQTVLDKLASPAARVLRTVQMPDESDDRRYEVFHDLLGRAIIDWRTSFFDAEKARRDKIKTARWILITVCGAVSFIALAVFASYLNDWKNQAEKSERVAIEKTDEALAAKAEAEKLRVIAAQQAENYQAAADQLKEARRQAENQISEISRSIEEIGSPQAGTEQLASFYSSVQKTLGDKPTQGGQSATATRPDIIALTTHKGSIWQGRFSNSGKYFSTACEDGFVRVWQAREGRDVLLKNERLLFSAKVSKEGSAQGAWRVAFDPTEMFLLAASMDEGVKLYRIPDSPAAGNSITPISQQQVSAVLSEMEFLPRAQISTLVTISDKLNCTAWHFMPRDVGGAAFLEKVFSTSQQTQISGVVFSTSGKFAMTSAHNGNESIASNLNVFAIQPGTNSSPAAVFSQPFPAPVRNAIFNPAPASTIIAAGMGKSVLFADFKKPEQKATLLPGHDAAVWEVAFSPNGKTLASVAPDGKCLLWDVDTQKPRGEVPTGLRGRIFTLAWSRQDILAIGGEDGWVEMWRMSNDGEPGRPFSFPGHRGPVWGVRFSADGKQLATWTRTLGGTGDYTPKATARAAESAGKLDLAADGTAALWDVDTLLIEQPAAKY